MNVAERSFFALAEPGDDFTGDALAAQAPLFQAAVSFTGPVAGTMSLTVPVALTRELAQLFSGDPDHDFSTAELIDMAGEFANMVTGSWLTTAEPNAIFTLGMPKVDEMSTAPTPTRLMVVNGQPVGLTWQVG